MLTKEEFYRKLADVTEAVFPSKKPYELSSIGIDFDDVMYNELANREYGNRIGLVSVSGVFFLPQFPNLIINTGGL